MTERRTEKVRVDQLLVDSGLAPSRARAQALILAGKVFHKETRMDKPGTTLRADKCALAAASISSASGARRLPSSVSGANTLIASGRSFDAIDAVRSAS